MTNPVLMTDSGSSSLSSVAIASVSGIVSSNSLGTQTWLARVVPPERQDGVSSRRKFHAAVTSQTDVIGLG